MVSRMAGAGVVMAAIATLGLTTAVSAQDNPPNEPTPQSTPQSIPPAHPSPQTTGQLTVVVDGLQTAEGRVCVKIFASGQGFPNGEEGMVRRECLTIAPPAPDQIGIPFTATFGDLPAGSYAIALYHDLNGDQQLNRGPFGIPSEGYGFSNNPASRTGPPNFGEASVLVVGSNTTIQVQLRYPG
ncbi:MAG TPA: DUF2141 domain-containing protein [Chroococcidiopsis sp.]